MGLLGRVPWVVWALLAPLVIMAGYRIIVGGGTRVPIVGAGPLGQLREEDAPEVARYVLGVRQRESLEATRARIESATGERSEYSLESFTISAGVRLVSVASRDDSSSTRSSTWFSFSSRLNGVA